MTVSTSRSWVRTALVVAVLYAIIGFVTVAINQAAGGGRSTGLQAVRIASWLLSALVFLGHLTGEARRSVRAAGAAGRASAAVALATFILALVATVRQVQAGNTRLAVLVALFVWPLLTGLVSLGTGWVLVRLLRAVTRGPGAS
jgi:hypothetical protein